MPINYDVPEGMTATIDGPAELRVRASSPSSRYQIYDTGSPPTPAPVIDFVAPTSAELPIATVDVGGSNFASTATVVFDGTPVATAYVSDQLLRGTLSAGAAGSYAVLVRDGAVDSNTAMFTFTDPVVRREAHVMAPGASRLAR
jgi:hypothetical protein